MRLNLLSEEKSTSAGSDRMAAEAEP